MIDGKKSSQLLISTLAEGHQSNPRIKKGSIEIFKILDTKIKAQREKDPSLPSMEDLLKTTLKKEAASKEKEESKDDVPNPYDEAKVQAIMKIFAASEKSKPAAGKSGGFRSFMKNKKKDTGAADKADDVLVADKNGPEAKKVDNKGNARQLKIKTGTLTRCMKDYQSYQKEEATLKQKV